MFTNTVKIFLFLVFKCEFIFTYFNRILLRFAEKLGVSLNTFIMDDDETFYLVNEQKKYKNYEVKKNPNILKYNLLENEKNKSADELLQGALRQVFPTPLLLLFHFSNIQMRRWGYTYVAALVSDSSMSRGMHLEINKSKMLK